MNRGGPLAKVSKAKAAANRQQQRAYRVVEAGACYCQTCGATGPLDHSHILTQKAYPQHAANPLNIWLECRFTCHASWENDKQQYATDHPEAFAAKLAIIQQLEPQAHAFFLMKNEWARRLLGGG